MSEATVKPGWQRMLDLLSDGRPHAHHEIYRLALMAHSRASDLRGRGYAIETWQERRDGRRVFFYQLVALPPAAAPQRDAGAGTDGGPAAAVDGNTTGDSGVPKDGVTAASSLSLDDGPAGPEPLPAGPDSQLRFDLPARLRREAAA